MEQLEKIRKLKKSEKEILGEVYWIIFYMAIALVFLSIILIGTRADPIVAAIIAIILAIIYTLALIYLIGLAVAFGTIRARRVFLKAEIDIREEEKQEEEGEIE